jgi:hypothetical protein
MVKSKAVLPVGDESSIWNPKGIIDHSKEGKPIDERVALPNGEEPAESDNGKF